MDILTVSPDSLNVESSLTKSVVIGSKQVETIQATFSSTTNNNMSLNYSVATKAIISNEVYINCTLQFTVTSPVALPQNLNTYYGLGSSPYCWSVRNYALLYAFQNINVRINNAIFSVPLKDLVQVFGKMISNEDALKYSSGGPSVADRGLYNYIDLVGSALNPNSGFQDAATDWVPRGSYKMDVTSGTQTNQRCDFKIELTTPLLAPPFFNPALSYEPVAMSNISTINIDINLDPLFSKSLCLPSGWSHAPTGANVFGASTNGAKLLMIASYPQDFFKYPSTCVVPHTLYDLKYESFNPLTISTTPVTSNILQFESYGDAVVFGFRKPLASQVGSDSDSFFSLKEGWNMSINGDSTILSGYSKYQLWNIVKKYLNISFVEFSGQANSTVNGVSALRTTSGPLYMFRNAIDLPISTAGVVPNQLYKIQIQLKNIQLEPCAELTALAAAGLTVEMFFISIRSGSVDITMGGGASITTSTVTQKDVIDAISSSKSTMFESEISNLTGGKLMKIGKGKAYGKAYGMRGSALQMSTSVPKQHSTRF
jgi:hypothetical protein